MAVPSDLQSWRDYTMAQPPVQPDHLRYRQLIALPERARKAYDEARFSWLGSDVVLKTPDFMELQSRWAVLQAEVLYSNNAAAKSLAVSGAPTFGKSTAAMQLARAHELAQRARFPNLQLHQFQPSIYVVTPPATTPKMLMTAFCNFLGLPHTERQTAQALSEQVVTVLRTLGTSLVVLDEIHNVQSNRRIGAEAASTLKLFADRLDCAFIMLGIDLNRSPVFSGDIGAQLANRAIRYEMRSYSYTTRVAREEWMSLVISCQDLLPLTRQDPTALPAIAGWLFEATGGSIGRLRSLMKRAAIGAIIAGSERISKADLLPFGASADLTNTPTRAAEPKKLPLRRRDSA